MNTTAQPPVTTGDNPQREAPQKTLSLREAMSELGELQEMVRGLSALSEHDLLLKTLTLIASEGAMSGRKLAHKTQTTLGVMQRRLRHWETQMGLVTRLEGKGGRSSYGIADSRLRTALRNLATGQLSQNLGKLRNQLGAFEAHLHKTQQHLDDLRLLVSELALGQARNRQKLAMEMNESVLQDVAHLSMQLDRALKSIPPDAAAFKTVKGLVRTCRDSAQSARDLSFCLSPFALYDVGLEAAIQRLAEYTSRRSGISIETAVQLQTDSLDETVRVLLFCIVGEFLNNVEAHAGAKKVEVHIEGVGTTIRAIVRDDGVGFVAPKDLGESLRKRRIGLFCAQEWLKHLGGWLQVASRPGQGTEVLAVIPLA